jgi:flagellar biosynthetic protein FliR
MPENTLLTFVLVLARVTAFIGFFPLFARQQVPALVKAGLATALTVFWFGSLEPSNQQADAVVPLIFVLSIMKEVAIGILLAMLLGLILIPARIAGSYIGQEIGISMEPVTNTGSDQSTIVTAIFETFTIMMFFVLNLHHFLILFLHYSLTDLLDRIHIFSLPTEGLVSLVSQVTENGLSIAAPIGVLSFVTMIGLYLLSKAAPSLNLFSIGMPLRVGMGVLMLAVFTPILWRSIESYFASMLFEIEAFFGYFTAS